MAVATALLELRIEEGAAWEALDPCVAVVDAALVALVDAAAMLLRTERIEGQAVTYGSVIARSV